ncbi:MAG: TonB-dependent receptor [Alishewanella aestuarii]
MANNNKINYRATYPRNLKPSLVALAISSCLVAPALAQAATTTKEDNVKLERIEVTARRTVESLQEVPVSLTSIDERDLAERGISVLTEIQQFSPNTTLQTSRGTNSTLTAVIRGVGQQDPLWGYEPGVGIYIDDIYMARPQGAVLDLLDVQRIEVLRGPQGTLYGKNTIGGAVKYVTREMVGDATMEIQGTVGSYNQRDLKVTGQLPLVQDKLYLGYGYANLNRDGFGDFLISKLPGQDTENYNKDLQAGRLTLEFRPSNDLFFRLNWDKTKDDSNSKGGFRLLPSIVTTAPVPDSVYNSYTSLPTWNNVELEGVSLTADWTVNDNLSLKYVGAKRESYSETNIDFDNTPVDVFDVPAIYDDKNTSHELQATYLGDRYKVVGGVYYYDGESCGVFDAILGVLGRALVPGTPGLTREVSGCNNSDSWAAYAQASYTLNDQWSMTLGARHTYEKKEAYVANGTTFDILYPKSGWIPGYVRPGDGGRIMPIVLGTDTNGDGILDAPKSESWSQFSPRIGVEYKPSRDLMFFASYAQGFKSGTFNPRATINEPAANPEVVDTLELGMKSDWNDNLRANITLFALDHKDRQYVGIIADPSDASALNQYLSNVASSTAKGVEADLTFAASKDLTLKASIGYLNGKIKENNAIPPLLGLANTPKLTANLSAIYTMENEWGYFAFAGNYYHRGEYRLFETSDLLVQKGYGTVNLSATWESKSGYWFGGLHVKNLTDKEFMVGGYDFVGVAADGSYLPGLGGDLTLIGYYGDPRTVSLTVGYRF